MFYFVQFVLIPLSTWVLIMSELDKLKENFQYDVQGRENLDIVTATKGYLLAKTIVIVAVCAIAMIFDVVFIHFFA